MLRKRTASRRTALTSPLQGDQLIALLSQNLGFAPRRSPLADASVLIAITEETHPQVLFTRRAQHMKNHAGEVSFPGGKRDSGDTSNIVVALREAHEETGLNPFEVRLLGELPSQRSKSGLRVKPVIGLIPPDLPLIAQPEEIDRIFYVPLSHFLHHPPQPYQVQLAGRSFSVPSFQMDGEIIWGLTGRIMVAMIAAGLGRTINWPFLLSQQTLAGTLEAQRLNLLMGSRGFPRWPRRR